ncbi:MAG: asparagine synthase C-terminal domain-containing protein [Planctomycetaceae bacterium]|nr:asparagine synthase C-terminal domain-containing protein [Planctomycetaceae bacterium]
MQVGTFLSGGIDSTIMTGLASEYAGHANAPQVRSFTIGFQHNEYNEANVALETSDRLNTQHEMRIIEGGIVEVLPQLAWYYDEPFADSSMIPVWFVAQLAAGKTNVIFCGDGGDELFAGYLRYQAIELASKLDMLPKPLRQFLGGPLRRMIPAPTGQKSRVRRLKRFLEAVGYDSLERYSQWITLFNKERLAELLAPDFAAQLANENPLSCCEEVLEKCPGRDLVTAISSVDLLTSIVNDAMVKVGTAASAFGLECRYPFLSREMVELAFQIPSRFKRQGAKGKLILRDVYRRFLPPEIDSRPKMGFGAPLDHWLRHGALADHAREMLTDPQTMARGYFRQNYVERLLDEHQNGVFDHAYRIWALLMLEYWHRVHV